MGRKGVIKIVEAVIASVILLASITYFISPSIFSEPGVGWSNAMLKLKADDILAVLALNGTIQDAVVLNNGSKLGNEISSMLRGPIDFIVEIEGLPNPVIYVESNKKNLLENLIGTSLNYRGREITIYIKTISWSNIDPKTNIIFLFGYENLSSKMRFLNLFLDRGGTIFMLTNLTEEQTNDNIIKNIFDLEWNDIGNPSAISRFYDYNDPEKISFRIAKYFTNISGLPPDYPFANFERGIDINHIAVDSKTIIISTNKRFSFVKVNEEITKNGNGRAVWFADYDYSDANTTELLKAVILWASGEKYQLVPDPSLQKELPSSYFTLRYIIANNRCETGYCFEPYQVNLKVWHVFY